MTIPESAGVAPHGIARRLSLLVTRILAPNPSPFTYSGTQSYLVGAGAELAVIDPGPADPGHLDALARAVAGRRVGAILCTHSHRDHSPAARVLADRLGAPVIGCAALALEDDGPRADAAFDPGYCPDRVLRDGDNVTGEGWTLRTLATPGHTSNHLCYALEEENALFTGDHVMGWSTTVVSPPDGDMTEYLCSLRKLLERTDQIYYPAHGDPVENPARLVRGMLGHRKSREGQILRHLASPDGSSIAEMVAAMYRGVDIGLHPAAARSVQAHLVDLQRRGLAWPVGPSMTAQRWRGNNGA